MSMIDMIFYWAKIDPHRPALVQPDLVTTYEAFAGAIDSIATRIAQLGLDLGEPVAVSLKNPSFFIATVLAVLRSGYSAALVGPTLYPLLRPSGVRNLIYDLDGQMLSGGRNIRFDMSWVAGATSQVKKHTHRKDANANGDIIFFTSGTTGLPKKVVQAAAALDRLLAYGLTCASGADQKILIMAGLASTFGFNRVCEVLNAGKTACFAPDNESALSLLGLFGAEILVASAVQAMALAKIRNSNPAYKVDTLNSIFIGGGKIAPEGISQIRGALCRKIINQYGSTEAGVVALTPFDVVDDGSSVIPLPWVEVEVVDESGQPLPTGAEGLIRYRTPQFIENLKVAGSNATPGVRDGWFYPGDIGSLTAEGVLRFAGRSSDVINRGGIKVSGTRIEEILEALTDIKEAGACGVIGPSGLEEIWIAIVASAQVDIARIKRHLLEHDDIRIAPDEVFVVDELPRGELGKIQKYRLRELMLGRKRGN